MMTFPLMMNRKGFGLPCLDGALLGVCSIEGEGEAAGGGGAAAAEAPAGGEAAPEGGAAAPEAGTEEQVTSLAGGAGGGGRPAEGEAAAAGDGEEAPAKGEGEEGEGEEKPAVLGAPEAYDLKAPDGMAFDTEAFEAVEPVLRELDLSGTAAQALVSAYGEKVVPLIAARVEQQLAAKTATDHAEFKKSLEDAARADPEIGGANFDQTIDAVATVWERFGIKPDTGIRKMLNETGFGNDPDLLRFLSRVGKGMGEGNYVPPEGGPAGARKTDAEVFYPDSKAQ